MKASVATLLCLILCVTTTLQAADSSIGVAMANGKFFLDRSPVVGNANVFDGSLIETNQAMSDLSLNSGLKIRLGTASRGKIFTGRLELETGAGQISGPNSVVMAGRLHVIPVDSNAIARVAYGPRKLVEVTAVGGRVRVETAEGIRVANMDSGIALSFFEQAGASAPASLSGKVERKNGKLMLTDATTNVSVELKGTNLEQYVGKRVTVTGNMVGADVLQVLSVTKAAAGAVAGAAAAGGAAAGAGAGAGAGIGLSAAAIAGIAIAGGTGLGVGLAGAAGAFSSGSASK